MAGDSKRWVSLPFHNHSHTHKKNGKLSLLAYALLLVPSWLAIRHYITTESSLASLPSHQAHHISEPQCPQVRPLNPSHTTKELDSTEEYLKSDAFRTLSIARLSGAVRIATQSFDDLGTVGQDPRWDIFYSFADYLVKTYPLVHATLTLEKLNTHALLYTWPGTDPTLKPNLLMAHQDVVPVPSSTVSQWTHPPFSGYYDGRFVWGRGASDCKNQLIAILSAVEALVSAGFTPRRTLILAFGFDEEVSGQEGAAHLSRHLLSRYGPDSLAAIVDEGAVNVEAWGAQFAIPGVAEKGAVDVDIVVRMPGGHSSIPPEHNGIGVSAELVSLIEANPYEPKLVDENPYLALLKCGAEHAPEFPKKLRKLLGKRSSKQASCFGKKKDRLALEAAKAGLAIKYLFTTSVAVDLISGGVKTNALPERTEFTVNHRINVGSDSEAVKSHIAALAGKVAAKYNLTLHTFESEETPRSITLSARDTLLEPSPVTPTALYSSTNIHTNLTTPFAVLSGTTLSLYPTLLLSPGIMTGNTDTRYYWSLSRHIFRYTPGWDREQEGFGNIHTVDERIGVRAHTEAVLWVWGWIRNMDEALL